MASHGPDAYHVSMTSQTPDLDDQLSKASVARAYDFLLGGKDNYASDRQFAEELLSRDPQMAITAKINKDFGLRAVDYIVRQKVRQFLDLGSGIPTSPPSVHHTARRVSDAATVVYVDHDPVVAAHNRALSAIGPGLTVIQDSLLNIEAIFEHPEFTSIMDSNRPIGVLLLSVLQNTPHDEVLDFMTRLRSRLAPGSHLAISHVSDQADARVQEMVAQRAEAGTYPRTWFRSDAEILEYFTGFELVEPGLVDYRDWRASIELQDHRPELRTPLRCGVGILAG